MDPRPHTRRGPVCGTAGSHSSRLWCCLVCLEWTLDSYPPGGVIALRRLDFVGASQAGQIQETRLPLDLRLRASPRGDCIRFLASRTSSVKRSFGVTSCGPCRAVPGVSFADTHSWSRVSPTREVQQKCKCSRGEGQVQEARKGR